MIWGEPHNLRGTRLTPEKWPVSRTPAASAARQRRGVRCGDEGGAACGLAGPGPRTLHLPAQSASHDHAEEGLRRDCRSWTRSRLHRAVAEPGR